MTRLREKYTKTVVPELQAVFGYQNVMQVPRITKIVVNVGLNSSKDASVAEVAADTLRRITGQQPVKTLAKKSISNFKIREGNVVGLMVTLRGARMYDFLDKLINITFPRIRDFRGVNPKVVGHDGNLSIGFSEHIAFPEIRADEVEKIHGLQVTIATNAKTHEEGLKLFEAFGIPFIKLAK